MQLLLPNNLRSYGLTLLAGLVLGGGLGILVPQCMEHKPSARLASVDGEVSRMTVTPEAPLQALDKKELRQLGAISSAIEKKPEAAVLATGNISDSSGSRSVAAVLDVKTGDTDIVQYRKFFEWMNHGQVGAGYGIGTIGSGPKLSYRHEIFRIGEVYGGVEAEAWQWRQGERTGRTDFQISGMINYRW
jgi:hypothetical protein